MALEGFSDLISKFTSGQTQKVMHQSKKDGKDHTGFRRTNEDLESDTITTLYNNKTNNFKEINNDLSSAASSEEELASLFQDQDKYDNTNTNNTKTKLYNARNQLAYEYKKDETGEVYRICYDSNGDGKIDEGEKPKYNKVLQDKNGTQYIGETSYHDADEVYKSFIYKA